VLFYGIFGYLLFGNILAILSGGLIFLFFVIVTSIIPIFLLNNDQIHNNNYSKQNIILAVNITHILLIVGFIIIIIIYENHLGGISPELGYIVVGSSLVINILCLMMDIKKRWAIITIGIHVVMFLLFAGWEYVGFGVVSIGFFYMIIHNIFVVSYGILRYSQYMISKTRLLEE